MIITGGFNVWPTEVEDAIYTHPLVQEAVVFGVADPKWGEAVTAIVVPRAGTTLSQADVVDHLRPLLSSYKVPKTVLVRVQAIPKSAVGKPLRRQARIEFEREV
jgi:acyl-CoA synthetase (AMP-forming)/AMP-acid ligase II